MRHHRHGFTLIELLVVIAIILTLLAILAPAMKRALVAAEQAACSSNLHQQGLALINYTVEYRHYPATHGTSSANDIIAIWVTRIRKMATEDRDIFYCPSEPAGWQWQAVFGSGAGFATAADVTKWGYELGEMLLRVNIVPFSYGYNDWGASPAGPVDPNQRGLGGDIGFGVVVNEIPAGKVVNPSQMIAISDNLNTGNWRFNIDPTSANEWPAAIHREGANFAFCDGHIEWMSQADSTISGASVSPDTWSPVQRNLARLWNNTNYWDPR